MANVNKTDNTHDDLRNCHGINPHFVEIKIKNKQRIDSLIFNTKQHILANSYC